MQLLLEVLAGMALFFNDIFAVVSVLCSVGIFIVTIINLAADPPFRLRVPHKMSVGSIAFLVCGVAGQIALTITGQNADPLGFVFRLSQPAANLSFLLSFLLLVASVALSFVRPRWDMRT